jgi:hypothetical protein
MRPRSVLVRAASGGLVFVRVFLNFEQTDSSRSSLTLPSS